MVKKVWKRVFPGSFRCKLMWVLVMFSVFPSVFIYDKVMQYYEADMIKVASDNLYSTLDKTNRLIEGTLKRIEDMSYIMLNNKTFYEMFNNLEDDKVSNLLKKDRIALKELGRYFFIDDIIVDAYFYTNEWVFAQDETKMRVDKENIYKSGVIDIARKAAGQAMWVTGYDYGEKFNSEYIKGESSSKYRYPLTMVREMNFHFMENNNFHNLESSAEKPILILHVLEEELEKIYKPILHYDEQIYVIVNKEGNIISSNNEMLGRTLKIGGEMKKLIGESGITKIQFNEVTYLLCYDTVEPWGWCSFNLVPMERLVKNTEDKVFRLQIKTIILLLLVAVIIAALFSFEITKPIQHLNEFALRIAKGQWRSDSYVDCKGDFKILGDSLCYMEKEIIKLTQENYEISLRERDARIMALSLQINPHFLYNTLNTINMLALSNQDEETSELIVSLAEMLSFTFKNTSEKISLIDEIQWITNYMNIMSKRFEGVFTYEIKVQEELYDLKVPKFFLQPIVENCILHGFKGLSYGGKISILAKKEDGKLYFVIKDNGKGMTQLEVSEYVTKPAHNRQIGINNVHSRLALIYGEEYSVEVESVEKKGTSFMLSFPV